MITPDDGSRNHCRNVAYALTAPNKKTMEKVQKITPEKLKNPSYQTFREQFNITIALRVIILFESLYDFLQSEPPNKT